MSIHEVVELMKSSRSEAEWNDNCDRVKRNCGGYPSWWYETIIMSGLLHETSQTWSD